MRVDKHGRACELSDNKVQARGDILDRRKKFYRGA
jgi:hypothetical protein